jgi:hypothetical protein
MKIVLSIIGVFVILVGCVWFLQGANILPGSVMTGDPQWSINGAIAILVGAIVIWLSNRGKDSRKKKDDQLRE